MMHQRVPRSTQPRSKNLLASLLSNPTAPYVAPAVLAGVPHAVVRDRITFNITDSGAASGGTVLALGLFVNSSGLRMPLYGTHNAYTQTGMWASGATLHVPTILSASDAARVRLSRMVVRIVAGVPSTGLFPTGNVYTLSLPTVVDFGSGDFANVGSVATWIKSRLETRTHSAARVLSGVNLALLPNDLVSNASLEFLGGTPATPNVYLPDDGWGTIAIAVDGSASSTVYTVTVHAEWSVEYTSSSFKQTLHMMHPTRPSTDWSLASRLHQLTQGIVSSFESAAEVAAAGAAGVLGTARWLAPAFEAGGAAVAPLALIARRRGRPRRRPRNTAPPSRRRR